MRKQTNELISELQRTATRSFFYLSVDKQCTATTILLVGVW
jgi:hypothetical protein